MNTRKIRVRLEIVKGKHPFRVINQDTGLLIAKMRLSDSANYLRWNAATFQIEEQV